MPDLTLTARDGHRLGAYQADPSDKPTGAVIVIQEIFGVNSHIRSICDRLAGEGYVAIAPALFDRSQPDFQSGYTPAEIEQARQFIADPDWDAFVMDTEAARAAVADHGNVGVVGFCLGGSVAFLAATRLTGIAAASCFYGGKIDAFADEPPKCPVQMHFGEQDHGIPLENVERVRARRGDDCEIFVYADAGHGFHCDQRDSFHAQASSEAWSRTLHLFAANLV